jgi:hypothetical protein
MVLLGSSVTVFGQASSGSLAYNQSTNNYLPANGEQYWTFYGQAGDWIEASVVSDQFDPMLLLLDPYGQVLEHAVDAYYPNRNAYLQYQLGVSGIYQLWVKAQAGFGYYLLSLNQVQPRTPAYLYQKHEFEGSVSGQWQPPLLGYTPTGRGFLGPFGNASATLMLTNLPIHDRVTLDFDVYVINSWDGNFATPGLGPDLFRVYWTNTNQVLTEVSFSNYAWTDQSYPDQYGVGHYPPQTGANEKSTLGYPPVGLGDLGSSVYHFTFHLTHSDPWLQFVFWGLNLEPLQNESWGLDNVRIFLSQQDQYRPISLCTNQTATNLRPGMHLETARHGLRLMTLPGSNETFAPMPLGNQMLILDGPICQEGAYWWLVEIEASRGIGWIAQTDIYGQPQVWRRSGTGVDPVPWVWLSPNVPMIEGLFHNGVNIRALPSVESERIGSADRGVVWPVIGRSANGRWLQIEFLDSKSQILQGWVCRHLVRQNAPVDGVQITEWLIDENCRSQPDP